MFLIGLRKANQAEWTRMVKRVRGMSWGGEGCEILGKVVVVWR